MSAPLFDVTVNRSGREEQVLRLGDDEHVRLSYDTPTPTVRESPQPSELEALGALVRVGGGDPETVLRRELEKQAERGSKAWPRLLALFEEQKERRRAGMKARAPSGEAHRKQLQRTFKASLPSLRRWMHEGLEEAKRLGFRAPGEAAQADEAEWERRRRSLVRIEKDEPAPAEREEHDVLRFGDPQTSELELFARLIRWNGGDPEEILRLAMVKMTKRGAKAGPRLAALLERERRIRERAAGTHLKKARGDDERDTGEKAETHRKRLRRTLDALVLFGYVRDPEKKLPIWAAIERAEREVAAARVPGTSEGVAPPFTAPKKKPAGQGARKRSPR